MDRRHFMAGATLALSAGPAAAAGKPTPAPPLAATVSAFARDKGFNGTVLVERRGAVLHHRGYGLADRAFAVPCARDTRYRIASITKLFTAAMVMQLVDEGRLTLDTTVREVLPGWKGEGAGVIRVRQLLNHTSGLANMDNLPSFAAAQASGIPAYQLPHTSDDLLALYASGKQVAEPGKAFDYNNADYVVLGKMIEARDGATYDASLARRITGPLALADTGLVHQQDIAPRLAATYYKDGDKPLINDLPVYMENWYAAGGMASTTSDLARFAAALYGGRLVKAASLKAMLTPGLDDYGFGQWAFDLKVKGVPHRVAQRPGRIMGANASLLRFLDDDVTVVILANTNVTDIDAMSFAIGRVVVG